MDVRNRVRSGLAQKEKAHHALNRPLTRTRAIPCPADAGRRAACRLLRRAGRHTGAPARDRRHDALPDRNQCQPWRRVPDCPAKRCDPGRGSRSDGRPAQRAVGAGDRFRTEHDQPDLPVQSGHRPLAETRRRDHRHAFGPRRQPGALAGPGRAGRDGARDRLQRQRLHAGPPGPGGASEPAHTPGRGGLCLECSGHDQSDRPDCPIGARRGGLAVGRRGPLCPAWPDRRAGVGLRFPGLLALQILRPPFRRRLGPLRPARGLACLQGTAGRRSATRQVRDRDAEPRGASGGAGSRGLPGRPWPDLRRRLRRRASRPSAAAGSNSNRR